MTGFPAYLNAILSCHVCSTSGNYVSISFSDNTYAPAVWATTFGSFRIDGLPAATPVITTPITCYAAAASTPVSNCLIYAYAYDGTTYHDDLTKHCVAC